MQFLKEEKKTSAASLQPRKIVFFPRETFFWPKTEPGLQPRQIVKNTNIGLKQVAVGAFGMSPIPKCKVLRA